MKALLVLSLTGNLVVIGIVAGHAIRDSDRKHGVDRQIAWILRLVPDNRRQMAEAEFAPVHDAIVAAREDRRRQLDQVVAIIRTEPFEKATLAQSLDALGSMRTDRRDAVRQALVSILARFTPAERATFADRLEDSMQRWRERHD